MKRFRKRPVEIEAVQWTGRNVEEISQFCPKAQFNVHVHAIVKECYIPTREGTMIASAGDWIIKGIKGEFYPCKPEIFAETYEAI